MKVPKNGSKTYQRYKYAVSSSVSSDTVSKILPNPGTRQQAATTARARFALNASKAFCRVHQGHVGAEELRRLQNTSRSLDEKEVMLS